MPSRNDLGRTQAQPNTASHNILWSDQHGVSRRDFLGKAMKHGFTPLLAPIMVASFGQRSHAAETTMSDEDIVNASATNMAQMIRNGQISPLELMRIQIARIKAVDPTIQCIYGGQESTVRLRF